MSVELPFAPVDSIIRRADPNIRVGGGAPKELAKKIQEKGAKKAKEAADIARKDNRKTLMAEDIEEIEVTSDSEDNFILPLAPIDRIARLEIEDFRVSEDARKSLASYLEKWGLDVAESACQLAKHSGRRTVKEEDITAYFEICNNN